MENQTNSPSRIGFRSVFSGIIISCSVMLLLQSLSQGLGVRNPYFAPPGSAALSWVVNSVTWAIALYAGGFIAAWGSRSKKISEGIVNAIAVCSGSFLVMRLNFFLSSPGFFRSLTYADSLTMLKIFLNNLFAFGIGICGGIVGVHVEQHTKKEFKGEFKEEFKEHKKVKQMPSIQPSLKEQDELTQ